MRIFISIAAYRDRELPLTVASLIENADRPTNLHIGVVQQATKREMVDYSDNPLVSEIRIRAQDAKGAGYARARAQEMYQGEDFFMQIDSHTRVDKGWDTDLIHMYNQAVELAGTDKIILSQFPKAYVREEGVDLAIDEIKYPDDAMKQEILWANKSIWSASRVQFSDPRQRVPEESTTVLAGFIFAKGTIVEEVPYDPDISFFGEELCFAIRAWTRGWKIYSPNKQVISHFYTRKGHEKIWDAGNNTNKKWGGIEKRSMNRQADIYNGNILGLWGAPDKESLKAFEDFAGVEIASLYNHMLEERGIQSQTHKEAEIDMFGFQPMLSMPCMEDEHNICGVDGCECPCHTQ